MLDFIFNAKSIAVIGASNRPGKIGFEIFRNIVEGGFQGKIYPINPKITELMGHTCYHTIKDVPDTVDLAVIVIPAPIVPEVLEQCGEKGVKGVIIISAGFSEVGNVELEEIWNENCRSKLRGNSKYSSKPFPNNRGPPSKRLYCVCFSKWSSRWSNSYES